MLEGETTEDVETFRYLGSIVDARGGTEADVNTIINAKQRLNSTR